MAAGQGVAPGDRVALMLRNRRHALALMLAIARAGAVWVPVNTQAVGDNLAYTLTHAEPRVIVAEADLLPVIAACGAELRGAVVVGVDAAAVAQDAEVAERPALPLPDADAPFAIMYTSGHDGPAEGCARLASHAAAVGRGGGASSRRRVDGDVLYLWEPLYHIGGAQMIVLPLIRDVTLVLAERFSASRFWNDVTACGATHMHFLGGILQILLKQPPGALDRSHPRAHRLGRRLSARCLARIRVALRRRDPRMLRHDGVLELHDGEPQRHVGLGRDGRCRGSM